MTRVWLLNLDAELELADPDGYRASSRMRARIGALADAVAREIRTSPGHGGDLVLRDGLSRGAGDDREGVAWCPTPHALATLRDAGCSVAAAPSLAVLQRVNHRSFAADLGQHLPGARFVRALAQLDAVLAGNAQGDGWLLKRPFGFSGRWRKRTPVGPTDGDDRTWAAASMDGYGRGLQVEPFVDVVLEVALHGLVGPDGTLRVGAPLVLETDPDGSWVRNRALRTGELDDDDRRALCDAADRAAAALARAGYFGPFGIDGFRWRAADGSLRFVPRNEINARYTMGWWRGMQ